MIDDLSHLVLGQKLAPRPLVTRLAAHAAPTTTLSTQFLGLRARLRASLLTRLRRIRRRRLRPGTRTLPCPLLKTRHPLVQEDDLALIPRSQLKQKLNARHAPGVIDRLRLPPLHTTQFAVPAEVPPSDRGN